MRKIASITILLLLLTVQALRATPETGGLGLVYLHSAKTLPKGYLEFFGHTRYFGKVANFGAGQKAYTLWNVRGMASFNYGINPHIEAALSPIFYQDTNRGDKAFNFIDDIFLSLKVGSYSGFESPFVYGGMLGIRLPTGRIHNIIYEPYSSEHISLGITGLLSYFRNVAFQEEGWSVHGNLGYWNHNDVGTNLAGHAEDPTPQSMTSEITGGSGIFFPAGSFDFSAEFNGRYFLTRPPATAYSREFVSYLTAGVYYKPYRYLTFEAALDIRFYSGDDLTEYETSGKNHLPAPPTKDFPNYPSWRGLLGVKIAILPTSLYKSEDALLRRTARDRRVILEKMLEEQKDPANAEAKLYRIRSERQKVEEELERLRKLLEAEKEKNKNP